MSTTLSIELYQVIAHVCNRHQIMNVGTCHCQSQFSRPFGNEKLTRVRCKATNNAIVVAVFISFGVLPIATPQLFAHAPDAARLFEQRNLFDSCERSASHFFLFFKSGE